MSDHTTEFHVFMMITTLIYIMYYFRPCPSHQLPLDLPPHPLPNTKLNEDETENLFCWAPEDGSTTKPSSFETQKS
jgi:hypothetical protein